MSLHHVEQIGAGMVVHEAEEASYCWGGETSRNKPSPWMLLAWKRVEEVQTQGDGSDMGMIVSSSWRSRVNFEVHIS